MSNAIAIVEQIKSENKDLFSVSRKNARAFFESKPSKKVLTDHFIGRMVNERMNMVEISSKIATVGASMEPAELELLSKQAHDEAVHFRMVKEVVERISGEKVDVEKAVNSVMAANTQDGAFAKGASLLSKYEANTDEVALALYQLIAEGRAEAVWDEMSKCIDDKFISSRYSRIAKDEGFHSSIGAQKLTKLLEKDEAAVSAKIAKLAPQMRADLLTISQENTRY